MPDTQLAERPADTDQDGIQAARPRAPSQPAAPSAPAAADLFQPYRDRAIALFRARRLQEATAICRAILTLEPRHANVLSLLGVILDADGKPEEAIECLKSALAIRPGAPFYNNLGMSHGKLGRHEEALAAYRAALGLRPDYPEALNNLGVVLDRLGRWAEAEQAFRDAIRVRPVYPEVFGNLGGVLRHLGRLDEAAAAFQTAIEQNPAQAAALAGLGGTLLEAGQPEQAAQAFRRELALSPADPRVHNSLGAALAAAGRPDDAAANFRAALAQDAGFAEAHNNLGQVLMQAGRLEEAVTAFRRAVAFSPGYADARANLGGALRDLGEFDDAVATTTKALELNPSSIIAMTNHAIVLVDLGRVEEAVAITDRALALRPGDAELRHHRAMLHLMEGEYRQGWELYENRSGTHQARGTLRHFPQAQWQGEPLDGRTILLHGEQGQGDQIQFFRFAEQVVARGGRVMLEVYPALVRLFAEAARRDCPGILGVYPYGEAPGDFAVHAPLLSLPHVFGTTLATLPARVPYLHAQAEAAAAWRARLQALPGRRIGLVWAGGNHPDRPVANAVDRRRSLQLAQLAPLFAQPGLSFVSLQKGPPARQREDLVFAAALHDWTDELADFLDTASLIDGLDLVISVDTAVAHLAGAMGKPVWLLNRTPACWRWMRDRDDSPWYPTLRQFRQSRPGDWAGVVENVARCLRD